MPLSPDRFLLGMAGLLLVASSAWLGAAAARARLVPSLTGLPAHLATAVFALAFLIWTAEALGSFGAWEPLPYLFAVAAIGLGTRALLGRAALGAGPPPGEAGVHGRRRNPLAGTPLVPSLIGLAIAGLAVLHFAAGVKARLATGMTGFDSTWYHGPFAAGFFQGGDTWGLHFIAPQFLAWFYPATGEIFHAIGMLAFDRDLLSPLLNLGWLLGCLAACWCLGRPFGVAPWSLALGAIALSVPAFADQAGEARNDLAGTFFLLAAIAIGLNAQAGPARAGASSPRRRAGVSGPGGAGGWAEGRGSRPVAVGGAIAVGLAAGLAAGTKLNFLLPAAVLVVGVAALAPRRRLAVGLAAAIAAVAGGGYWYLRNLAHAGNPLPWVGHLGALSLPAPRQGLGGREAHAVLGYLGDGAVWSSWLLPGLRDGLSIAWPLLLLASLLGLVLALRGLPRPRADRRGGAEGEGSARGLAGREVGGGEGAAPGRPGAMLAVAGLAGLALALAWLVAPTSASGPEGAPRGFESGLRYLVPALVLGLSLLPTAVPWRARLARLGPRPPLPGASSAAAWAASRGRAPWPPPRGGGSGGGGRRSGLALAATALAALAVVAGGYLAQRHYLRGRYADPSFAAPGLNAAFAWAQGITGARIATTSTRQYPLFGPDLSNRVQFVGERTDHGGFEAAATCPRWRQLLNAGAYDYVVASRDRIEPARPPFPPQARWTESPNATVVLRKPPTVVFHLNGPLDPSSCPG